MPIIRNCNVTRTASVTLSAALALALSACQVEEKGSAEPAVLTVNPGYNRIRSHALVRRVRVPTEAELDFAAYSKNVMLADPEWKAVHPPKKIGLSDVSFNGLLQDVKPMLDFSPLTAAEKSRPMSWTPVLEKLLKWNFEKASGLANAYATVTGEKWGDSTDISQPFQEFASLYVHANGNVKEVWVELEFKPWLGSFLNDIPDEDHDGYPSLVGRLDPKVFTDAMTAEIAG